MFPQTPVGARTPQKRVVLSGKYEFSVVLPLNWYVFMNDSVPHFYNHRAEEVLDHEPGLVPPGRASRERAYVKP